MHVRLQTTTAVLQPHVLRCCEAERPGKMMGNSHEVRWYWVSAVNHCKEKRSYTNCKSFIPEIVGATPKGLPHIVVLSHH